MFYLRKRSTHFINGNIQIASKPAAAITWVTLFDQQERIFYMLHPTYRIAHTMVFVNPVMKHWLDREIAQWVHPMKDRSNDL